eukprot:jgi/Mesen1/8524/ME000480S07881
MAAQASNDGGQTNAWLQQGKVLICMSGAKEVELTGGKKQETGFFLKELGGPLLKLLDAGYSVEAESNFRSPRKFRDITDKDLGEFAGLFLPGGHAPMTDLWKDADLGRILLHFHQRSKPTGLICHAPIALLATREAQPAGEPWAYQGYKVTCYSDMEEKVNELMWWANLPFKVVESELRKHGAQLVEALPMMPKVTEDRELITGQGPTSVGVFGDAFVARLQAELARQQDMSRPTAVA